MQSSAELCTVLVDVQKELEKSGGAGQPGKGARLRLHYAGQSLNKM